MSDRNKMFVYPKDVDAFGFDWGRLALTVAPEVNNARRGFRAASSTCRPARATPATTIRARKRSSSSSPAMASRWSRTTRAIP